MIDITAVLTAHSEAILAGPSLLSFERAVRAATSSGLSVESLIILDRPDSVTLMELGDAHTRGHRITITEDGDPGMARNAATRQARGRFVTFLDADDLWCRNWLTAAHEFCKTRTNIVAHSECNIVFGNSRHMWWHADSEDAGFDAGVLRISNYWDAMSFAERRVFDEHPFARNDLSRGYGHEDWHWNCITLAAGISHRPIPGTVHFKRRRTGSQSARCEENDVVPWANPITPYTWKHSLGTDLYDAP
jgi:glycosyltransferase involved in cell wall biosynthesis